MDRPHRLVHSALPDGQYEQHDHGWGQYVPCLRAVLAGEDPGPDPNAGQQGAEPAS